VARLLDNQSLADVSSWAPGRTFDVVLLDAPCTATGTIRRHPDILRLKGPEDVARMAQTQARMLAHAATLVASGGLIVYATCSLSPRKASSAAAFLAAHPNFARQPVAAAEIGAEPEWISADGDLRTLMFHGAQSPPELAGLDGFYAARLRRLS
jgi:16S rRNA (cytosine967-C5)-methyltransferase